MEGEKMSSNRRTQSIDKHFPSRKFPRARRNLYRTKEEQSGGTVSRDKQDDAVPSSPIPGTGWKSEGKSQKKIREEAIAEKRRTRESSRTETELQSLDVNERFGEFETLASHLAPSPVSEETGPTERVKRKHEDAFRGAVDITDSASEDVERVPHRPVARRHNVYSSTTATSGSHSTELYQHHRLPTGLQLPQSHELLLRFLNALDRAFSVRSVRRPISELTQSINLQVSDTNFQLGHLRQILGILPGLYQAYWENGSSKRSGELMVQPTENVKKGSIITERQERFRKALLRNVAQKHMEFLRSRMHNLTTTDDQTATLEELLPVDGRWHPEFDLGNVGLPEQDLTREVQYPSSVVSPQATQKPCEPQTPSPCSSSKASPETSTQDTHASGHKGTERSARRSLHKPWLHLASKSPSTKQRKHEEHERREKSSLDVKKEELRALLWFLTHRLSKNGEFSGQLIADIKRATNLGLREKSNDSLLRMLGELNSLECITSTRMTTRRDHFIELSQGHRGNLNELLDRIDRWDPSINT